MKVRTHVRMTLDVLEAWKDELGFEPKDFMEQITIASRHLAHTWTVHLKDGRTFPMPHHRTRGLAHFTAEAVRVHAVIARGMWLEFKEGKIEKGKEREHLKGLVEHLATALHIAQDFCTWSKPRQGHDTFEAKVDELYKKTRKKLRGKKYRAKRSKIYNTYWELTDGIFSTTDDPERYIREAYRRSSELVSFIVSERKLDKRRAATLLKKYGEFFPETLDEVKYWDRLRPLFRLSGLIVLLYIVFGALTGGQDGYLRAVFTAALPMLIACGLTYIVSKIAEFKKNGMKYDVIPDAAEPLAKYFLKKYFGLGTRKETEKERVQTAQAVDRNKVLQQDYYIV